MKIDSEVKEEHLKILANVAQKEKQERFAAAALTTETLNRLNVSIDALPQKHQNLLYQTAELQGAMDVEQCNSHIISLRQTMESTQLLETEYEVLELRQKNQELQQRIDANKKFIEDLKRDLESSKQSLSMKNPNPENISEHIRQMKQKVASYEELCEKAKVKYYKLRVPDGVLPTALQELVRRLTELRAEEAALKQRADDVTLARQARLTLHQLRG